MIDPIEEHLMFLQKKIQRENEEVINYIKEWSSVFDMGYLSLQNSCQNYFQGKSTISNTVTTSKDSPRSSLESKPKEPHLTIRNNKIVYSLSNKGYHLSSSEIGPTETKLKRGIRGSKYRGVSRNGNQWQVLIMINKKKKYMGNYSSEVIAAKVYDKIAIKHHGTKAKTNFLYSKEEIVDILSDCKVI